VFDVAIGESTVYDSTRFRPAPFVCPVEQSQNLTLYLEFQPEAEKVRLSIPRGYFDPRLTLRDNRTRRGQVLRIHGERFEPWPPELLPVSKSGPYVGLLLTEYNPLQQVAERLAADYLGYRMADIPEFGVVDAIFGLETLVSDKQPYRDYDVFKMDLFIVRNDLGLITDVITCKKPESVPSPSCQQYMESPSGISKLDTPANYSNIGKFCRVMHVHLFRALPRSLHKKVHIPDRQL